MGQVLAGEADVSKRLWAQQVDADKRFPPRVKRIVTGETFQ
jgi:hypothetical protein